MQMRRAVCHAFANCEPLFFLFLSRDGGRVVSEFFERLFWTMRLSVICRLIQSAGSFDKWRLESVIDSGTYIVREREYEKQ